MLPTSTKTVERYTPPHLAERDPAPVFLIRTASYLERANWRRQVTAAGATFPGESAFFEALREGVRLLDPANKDALIEDIDAFEAMPREQRSEDRELAARIAEVSRHVRTFHGPFAALEGDHQYWMEVAPLIAARLFLLGWENVDGEFVRKNGVTTDETLAQLEDDDLRTIGWHAIGLMHVSKAQEKNSESPSLSRSSRGRSKATNR